jgi:hypothetical protein
MTRRGRPASGAGDSPFLPEALGANRSGTLTGAQRRSCWAQSRRVRWAGAGIGGLVIVVGLLFAVTRHSSSVMPFRPVVLAGCLLIGAVVLWRALTGGDRFTIDVRRGEVSSVEGALHKRAVRGSAVQGASPRPRYYFDVAGQALEVMWESAYEAAPQARYVRVFYLPRSRKAVNLERLPDPPAGEAAAIATMLESAKDSLSALTSPDQVKAAEAMAAQLAMHERYKQQPDTGPPAPPPDQLDPRPLASAIVGSWASALLRVTFRADGTMTASGTRGRSRDGRWAVGEDGRLQADVLGQPGPTSAWVAGDQLTIALKGLPFTLRRLR